MSAFQVAFEVLRRVTNDVAADEILTNLLNEHAHELAEGIRDFAARRIQIDSDDETYGMHMAADLIDPKEKP